jgi:transposase
MRRKGIRRGIRYSEAFKLEVVREAEEGVLNFTEIAQKYGIKGSYTIQKWIAHYGSGVIGKAIRVEKPNEIDQTQQLKQRVKKLEHLVADLNLDLAISESFCRIACKKAGITDIEGFKKKASGTSSMES